MKLSKKSISSMVNKSVVGFRVPIDESMPILFGLLKIAAMEGKSPEEMKAIVAEFPGVEVAN
jgi:hypothetical protein